jgi:hypothetical protein
VPFFPFCHRLAGSGSTLRSYNGPKRATQITPSGTALLVINGVFAVNQTAFETPPEVEFLMDTGFQDHAHRGATCCLNCLNGFGKLPRSGSLSIGHQNISQGDTVPGVLILDTNGYLVWHTTGYVTADIQSYRGEDYIVSL